MTTFPFMPCAGAYVPQFSQTLVWQGAISTNPSVDISSYVVLPYSSVVVVQLYDAGGGETFYYPPTAKMNGTDMPLVSSKYTNAFDDGNAAAVSVLSLQHGSPAVVTWGTSSADYAYIYVVTGFKDMFAALYNTAAAVNLASNNNPCPSTVTLNTTAISKVLYVSLGNITAGVDKSGQMNSFISESRPGGVWEIGWDYTLTGPTNTYNGGNRMTLVCSFDLSEQS